MADVLKQAKSLRGKGDIKGLRQLAQKHQGDRKLARRIGWQIEGALLDADKAESEAPKQPADMAEPVDFASIRIGKPLKVQRKCKKGFPCGNSCISRLKVCRKKLEGQYETAAQWLRAKQKQRKAERQRSQPDATPPAVKPPGTKLRKLSPDEMTLGPGDLLTRPEQPVNPLKSEIEIELPPPGVVPAFKTPRQVLALEDRIRKQKFESAGLYDSKGNQLFFKDGESSSVGFTRDEVRQMKNCVLTHNHPSGWKHEPPNPRHKGNSFSPEDLGLAAAANLAEIRAVSRGYRFSMRRPENGWPRWEEMDSAVEEEAATVRKRNTKRINAFLSKGDFEGYAAAIDDAEASHWHEVATAVAKRIGAEYTREDYKPL
ncbi:MAG TPA: hypothetical protein V6D06_15575 [Trichocoleus sp.]